MRLDRAERLLDLATLHLADGTPFAFERRRINLAAAPAAAAVDFTEVAPSVWLLGHVPWSKAEHRIDACAADAELADRLGVARGAALLRVERRTWAQVGTITQALQFFPAGTLALTATSGIDGP